MRPDGRPLFIEVILELLHAYRPKAVMGNLYPV
jgi:hypothetical protein